ncbi:hypothetical protein TRIP_C90058 [Candidatus Zixiibacteriota bacterium]|nr:hypothetical protein TRIP_C90058 [candidate division Zixibacteria bacterium]
MPGLNLVADINPLDPSRLSRSYQDLKFREKFVLDHYHSSEKISIGFLGYKGYPSQSFEDNNVLVLLEGFIYNKSDWEIDSALHRLVDAFPVKEKFPSAIAGFMDDCDGDYLALIYFKAGGEFAIFNDRWGRLPTFYSLTPARLTLSRDMKFLLSWADTISFNPIALAEFLSFEYNLGEKTIFKGIKRLSPATLLQGKIESKGITCEFQKIHPIDFTTTAEIIARKAAVAECVTLFRESLQSRVRRCDEKGLTIVTDLSGGFDTRAVLAGMATTGTDFIPATDILFTGDESKIAKRLAEIYGKELRIFRAAHPFDNFGAMKEITYLTDGFVNCQTASACYWDDIEREKNLKGLAVRFMGFGGEFIRHPYRPMSGCENLAEMIDNDAYTNFIPLASSATLLGLDRGALTRDIHEEIALYPEKKISDKVKHLYFEYYNGLVNAGENRHRFFAWTIPPLRGKSLFEFEMTQLHPSMIDYSFFIDFLMALDPRLLEISLYGQSVRLNKTVSRNKYLAKQGLRDMLRTNRLVYRGQKKTRRSLGRFRSVNKDYENLIAEISLTFRHSRTVAGLFDSAVLNKYLASKPPEPELYQILTVCHYLAELERRFPEKISY